MAMKGSAEFQVLRRTIGSDVQEQSNVTRKRGSNKSLHTPEMAVSDFFSLLSVESLYIRRLR